MFNSDLDDVNQLKHLADCDNKQIAHAALRLQIALLVSATAEVRAKLPKRVRKSNLIDGLTQEEEGYARKESGKIQAIKLVRDRGRATNGPTAGLREAKEFVEAWMQRNLGFKYWPAKAQPMLVCEHCGSGSHLTYQHYYVSETV